jgi:hypothetical protein
MRIGGSWKVCICQYRFTVGTFKCVYFQMNYGQAMALIKGMRKLIFDAGWNSTTSYLEDEVHIHKEIKPEIYTVDTSDVSDAE